MMVDDFEDPLDKEYECPQCGGKGMFLDGPYGGEYDEITCFTCDGKGSVYPNHHPGEDGKGARGMTVFDTREEQHRKDYDVENAMPYGNKTIIDGNENITVPYRQGFARNSPMKQTRVPIVSDEEIASTDPALRHRLPAVYMRELNGQPTNSGMNITGASNPLFTMGNPMDIAWRMLKHDN